MTNSKLVYSEWDAASTARTSRETSLFGSPEPRPGPDNLYRYRGPRAQDRLNDRAFFNPSILHYRDQSELGSNDIHTLGTTSWSEGRSPSIITRSVGTSDVRSESTSDVKECTSDVGDKLSLTISEGDLDDKLLAYRRRHFTKMGRQSRTERRTQLPSYDTSLLQDYQRSYIRQAKTGSNKSNAPLSGPRQIRNTDRHEKGVFPTVEDLDTSYWVEKQAEVALDPCTDWPELSEWMGLYHDEDGVFTLNPQQLPLTGKCCTVRSDQGVRILTIYRPPGRRGATFGFHITTMDNGVYVSHIESEGAAVRAGLRYGDQIVRVGDVHVSGMLKCQVEECMLGDELTLVVRPRPNDKLYTLLRDSNGLFGFRIRGSQIVEVMAGSSAARNGVPTNHYIIEINGRNVVGWNDDQLRQCMATEDRVVSFSLLTDRTYTDLIKDLGASLLASMDHSCNINIEFPQPELPQRFDWNPVSVFNNITEKTTVTN